MHRRSFDSEGTLPEATRRARKRVCGNAEASYLEPDQHFGFGYLEAIRRVFCPEAANP